MLSDLKWRLIYLVTGERPAPRTTSEERLEFFRDMVSAGMSADEAWRDLTHLRAEEMNDPSPPWA